MEVFAPQIVEVALLSTSAKQGYYKQQETIFQEKEAFHHDIEMVDLESSLKKNIPKLDSYKTIWQGPSLLSPSLNKRTNN